jgi:hypothetical protein
MEAIGKMLLRDIQASADSFLSGMLGVELGDGSVQFPQLFRERHLLPGRPFGEPVCDRSRSAHRSPSWH